MNNFDKMMEDKRTKLKQIAEKYSDMTANELLDLLMFGRNLFAQGVGITFSEALDIIKTVLPESYDSKFGDDKVCTCGHPYYRHFDTYENMRPVGCKYCSCYTFKQS